MAAGALKCRFVSLAATCVVLSATQAVQAASSHADPCPPGDAFLKDIFGCGMNDIGTKHANQCLQAFEADGMPPIASLRTALASSADSTTLSQRIKGLEGALKIMKKRADIVADYPRVMIDFPDAKTLNDSPDCFRDNFKKISAIVYKMDDIIIAARKVLAEGKSRLKQK